MPNPSFSSSADYNTMVQGASDGPTKTSPFTIGRHNKWGYLCIWGPNTGVHAPVNLGLVQSFSMQETTDTSFLPQAGTDWLELQIGSRMWRGSCVRYHVRGNDMKQALRRLYTTKDVDFRMLPFVIAYFFDYAPPNGVVINTPTKSYENITWVYHKVLVTDYTNDLITGPNRLLEERFNIISAGEEFQDMNQTSGTGNYRSTPAVWAGDYYGSGTATGGSTAQATNTKNAPTGNANVTSPIGAGGGILHS